MNNSWILWSCIVLFLLLTFVGIVFFYRAKIRRTMAQLGKMIDEARDGTFEVNHYDESLLSSVEAKMMQYLSNSEVSKKNLGEEKNRIKELISDISHQTKTPIANILLYSQLLKEVELSKESIQLVEDLNQQAEKLDFLIQSLIKISRLENGIMELQPKVQSIQPMLESVGKQVLIKAQQKEIELRIEDTLATAYFDRKWTTEAIVNIVDNAVKYSKKQEQIEIMVKAYELFVCIQIKDQGIGIAEAEQAQIFGRFYRSKMVSEEEGIGLGLYLAREIIATEGGYIKVASTVGKGSVFSVYLLQAGQGNVLPSDVK